ncbi:hypothetical protein ACSAZL_00835 [Methanosarcina sp. T3]|uniref:hypothetical protein n=1 Tax=Methanosarcina sp. T3 TaxID=3439062 RepID=UPI003F871195
MAFMMGILLVLLMPVDTNFDDPVFEPIIIMISIIATMMVILPVSIAVLKIKRRSMWWLLLFTHFSPLWLSDSKQQCKTNYIYAILAFDAICITNDLASTLEYVLKNPLDAIFWYGIFIYGIAMILTVFANSGFGKDDSPALVDLKIHDAKAPEAKE